MLLFIFGMALFFAVSLWFIQVVMKPDSLGPTPRTSPGTIKLGFGLAILGLVCVVGSTVGILLTRRRVLKREAEARSDGEENGAKLTQPVAVELARAWKQHRRMPKLRVIQACLGKHSPSPGTAGRVVVLGDLKVPHIGEMFFEPVVFTPSEIHRGRSTLFWLGLVFLALGGIPYLGLIPPPPAPYFFVRWGTGYVALGACLWLWCCGVRPTYLRLAPGVVQTLQYPLIRKRKPRVRSYAIDEGTLVVVVRKAAWPALPKSVTEDLSEWRKKLVHKAAVGRTTLSLVRGTQKKVIKIGRMRAPEKALDKFWKAILSTARRPTMSDEELLG